MDVWFDSGSSHAAVLQQRSELKWPADLYLEGADQYRGWFQSSLLTSVATRGTAPYKAVVTHGWVVDGEGRKMSKSLGNGIVPQEIIDQYGADILRLWVASSDYHADIRISKEILKHLPTPIGRSATRRALSWAIFRILTRIKIAFRSTSFSRSTVGR